MTAVTVIEFKYKNPWAGPNLEFGCTCLPERSAERDTGSERCRYFRNPLRVSSRVGAVSYGKIASSMTLPSH